MENEEMKTTPSAENNSNGMPPQTQTQPGAIQTTPSAQTTTPSAQTKENPASGQLKNATLLYDVNKLDENGNVVGGNTALYFGDPSKKAEASQLAMKSILANNGESLERTGMAPADGGASAGFKAGSYTANAIADLQEDASRRKLGRTYAHDKIVTDALVGIYKTFNGYGETIGTVVNSGGRKIAGIEREACEAVNQQLKQNGAEYRVVGMSVENGTNGKPLFKVYTVDKNGNKHIDIRTGDQVYDIRKTALADEALGVRIKGENESDRDKRRAELLASDAKTGMPSAIERRIIEELGDIKYAQGSYREKNAESIARAERDKALALASDTEQAIAMAKSEREDKRMELDAEQMKIDTRLKEAKIAGITAKALGVEGMGREGIARAVSQNPNAATSKIMELVPKLYDQFKTTNEPLTEDDGKGNKIPVMKDGLPVYRQLSHEETMERVYNAINKLTGSNIVTERMKKMEALKAMVEAEKNALNAQTAQTQAQTQPAPTAQPQATTTAQPAPTAQPQATTTAQPAPTAQPASPNLTDLSAPTQGGADPTNIVANLAKQTFGDPSAQAPTARQATPTAKSNSLTYEKIDNLERKPNETDEDYAERQADLRAGLRKKDFLTAGGVYETNEDGTEKFRLKDWEFLNENEGRNTIRRESDEFMDEMMDAQKLIQKKKSEYESKLKDERKKIRAEALKKHPASKIKRDKYISERMSEWEKENDPRLSKPVTAVTIMP